MRYMLLIYLDEQALNETERNECYEESTRLTQDLDASGQYLAAAPLHPTSMATSVVTLPLSKRWSERSRARCDMSPCIATALTPARPSF